jgi:putative hemolysin
MSEIAIVSSRKTRLELAAKRGSHSAKAALEIAKSPNNFLSTVQIGITLIGILTGILSADTIAEDIRIGVEKMGVAASYSYTVAISIVVISITFFSMVLGELVPKRIGLSNPEAIAKLVARPMNVLSYITLPFVWLLTGSSSIILRIFGIKPKNNTHITEEEIKAIIEEATEGGEIQEIEYNIMERVLLLGDRKIVSLMTVRNDIVYLDLKLNTKEIEQIVRNNMHSIYPVYDGSPDSVKGVVLLKDLFSNIYKEDFKLTDYLRKPIFLSENTSVYRALQFFRDRNVNFGIVSDEYGLTKGIITIGDVLGALVGNVSEFFRTDFNFEDRGDGTYIIDGQFPFHDFLLHFGLEDLLERYQFNTIGGLVLDLKQRVPKEGDKLKWRDFEFEILNMDNARIDNILLTRKKKAPEANPEAKK